MEHSLPSEDSPRSDPGSPPSPSIVVSSLSRTSSLLSRLSWTSITSTLPWPDPAELDAGSDSDDLPGLLVPGQAGPLGPIYMQHAQLFHYTTLNSNMFHVVQSRDRTFVWQGAPGPGSDADESDVESESEASSPGPPSLRTSSDEGFLAAVTESSSSSFADTGEPGEVVSIELTRSQLCVAQ